MGKAEGGGGERAGDTEIRGGGGGAAILHRTQDDAVSSWLADAQKLTQTQQAIIRRLYAGATI